MKLHPLSLTRSPSQAAQINPPKITLNPMKQLAKPSPLRLSGAAILAASLAAVAVPAARADYIKVNSLNIAPGGTFFFGGSSETVLQSTQHGMIVQGANAGAQAANITSAYNNLLLAYNGFDWLGTGLTSYQVRTDAQINGVLGVMLYDNNQLFYSNFAGATGLDTIPDGNANQVLMRMTYAGDFDGNGAIDSGDYGLLDFYLGSGLIKQGDINFDGVIDGGDYGLLDYVLSFQPYGNLGSSTTFFAGGGKDGVVPEPASGALLLAGGAWLIGLRRRKQAQLKN